MTAAIAAARDGHRVVVLEEHQTSGEPVHCTGVLAEAAFGELDLPRTAILNELAHVRFHAPGGAIIEYETPETEAVVIDRRLFDQMLGQRAREAGAQVACGMRVRDLKVDGDGVAAWTSHGLELRARAAILACGASYVLQRRIGLGMPAIHLQSAQCEIPASRPGPVEVFFGRALAPKGFAWAVPVRRPEGTFARVGVMAEGGVDRCFAALVDRLSSTWGLAAGPHTPRRKMLPLSSLRRTYSDRVLATGDAAGLVKPTTGGGIYYAIVSGRMAGSAMSRALVSGKLAARDLAEYQRQWRKSFMAEFGAQLALRMLAHRMSDEAIDRLFDLAIHDGVMPIVRRAARFNEHRGFIRELLRHPPARRLLFRGVASSIT